MRRLLSLCFLVLIILSCKDDITRINKKGTIPREDFVEILVSIHFTEAITGRRDFMSRYSNSDSVDVYENIFKKNNVTKAEFDSTVSMYVRQPELYKIIYDEVLLRLNYILDTLQNHNPKFSHDEIKK